MATTTASSTSKTSSDILANLANLLPTGTFLTFQAVVPLFTNNGSCNLANCGVTEKIMTALLSLTFCSINWILTFTDSISTTSGKHYYGLVTCYGLYNPQFKTSGMANVVGSTYVGDPSRYKVTIWDFINGILSVTVFATLALLTQPVASCYWPKLSITIEKTVPILVGIIAAAYFSIAPTPRRGVGYSVQGFVDEPVDDSSTPVVPDNTNSGTATNGAATGAATGATTVVATRSLNIMTLRGRDDAAPDSSIQSLLTSQQRTDHSTSPVHPRSVV
jgi:hypothetical protein